MTSKDKKRNLGRGLSALFGEDGGGGDLSTSAGPHSSKLIPIEFLHPGRYQPRRDMNEEHINELAQSIKEKGVLQPLLVRRHPDEANAFEIIAGERRWRASQKAKLHEIPVIIKDLSDQEALEIALVENLQRQDLSPLEEADGYKRLQDEFKNTQETLAKAVGKSRSHVANMMRLLGLPEPVKKMLESGALTAGHARALLNADDPVALARQIVDKGLNVRQTEALSKDKDAVKSGKRKATAKDSDTVVLEKDLGDILGLKVKIKFRGEKGALTIHYKSLDQLDDIIHRLSLGVHGAKKSETG